MPKLLQARKLAMDKGRAQGCNESYVKKLSDYIILSLVEALHKVRRQALILKILAFHYLCSQQLNKFCRIYRCFLRVAKKSQSMKLFFLLLGQKMALVVEIFEHL